MSQGLFLGREPGSDTDVRLKPSRLRTHGVVLGMTGSGKTGLSLVMLEELVAAGVPVICIDPKGDLGNLGLVFQGLSPQEFGPWTPPGEDATALSTRWREGVARSGLGPEQVTHLASTMALGLYTPGSEAGVPVDVLGALRRPPAVTLADPEATRDLVRDTVSGLMGLIGRKADPVKDPAHIVLSTVLEQAWNAGEDPDLEGLILKLVDPPFKKVGVFPLDRFFEPDDRMDLAMQLNGVVAAPSFAPWTKGIPLDMDGLLAKAPGRTPVSVFNIAHLDEGQRHFFVGLLFGRLLAWSRSQPGTEELRAVVFFDEVAGYLPPHPKSPPSKGPLLTLMKQARAVGLGVVLSTQNPVDLDYKALSNAGLWCVGRLQTQQDRERVLKGIGAPQLDDTVRQLDKRQFLLHQVGRGEPKVFGSRHAMCYLRGPFTRREVSAFVASPLHKALGAVPAAAPAAAWPAPAPAAPPVPTAAPPVPGGPPPLPSAGPPPVPAQQWSAPPPVPAPAPAQQWSAPPPVPAPAPAQQWSAPPPVPAAGAPALPPGRTWGAPPPVPAQAAWTGAPAPPPAPDDGTLPGPPPSDVPQRFLDPRAVFSARLDGAFEDAAEPPRPDGRIVYKPALWADLALRFDEARYGYDETYELHKVWFPLGEQLPDEARTAAFEGGDLLSNPPAGARFTTLPDWMDEARELKALQKRVVDDLYRSESRGLFINRTLKLYARGDEDRAAFDARCAEAVEELVDAEVAKLQARYETKIDRLDERIRKKEAKIVELEGVLKARKVEEAVNIGETLLSFFGGRKKSLGSAVTKRRMTSSTGTRITQAKDDIAALQEQGVELQDELEDAIAAIRDRHEGALEDTEEYAVGLEKADIGVRGFGVLWIPVTRRI